MAWLKAARPLAHANIALPLVYGQAFAHATTGAFSWTWFAVSHAFGVVVHLFIVFANDYADRDADRMNLASTIVSGGSRVLPNGELTPAAIRAAAAGAAVLLVLGSSAVAWFGARPAAPLLALVSVALLWAYSYPPLRLSYRGHGEWLQAVGTGAVLPAVGYLFQAGSFAKMPTAALLAPVCLGLASNVLTALPDTEADRLAHKRTLPVRWGERRARWTALVYTFVAAVAPVLGHRGERDPWFLLTPLVATALLGASLTQVRRADSSNRRACLAFIFLVAGAGQLLLLGWSVSLFRHVPR
ncbi:MAG: prenyltransferase [Myxococcales bacterium]|nr:prenyltransferase [Myxococcales bacterium]